MRHCFPIISLSSCSVTIIAKKKHEAIESFLFREGECETLLRLKVCVLICLGRFHSLFPHRSARGGAFAYWFWGDSFGICRSRKNIFTHFYRASRRLSRGARRGWIYLFIIHEIKARPKRLLTMGTEKSLSFAARLAYVFSMFCVVFC